MTENWEAYVWPLALDNPRDLCEWRLQQYIQRSLPYIFNWQYRNLTAVAVAKNQAVDCSVPSGLPHFHGGPGGAWTTGPGCQCRPCGKRLLGGSAVRDLSLQRREAAKRSSPFIPRRAIGIL